MAGLIKRLPSAARRCSAFDLISRKTLQNYLKGKQTSTASSFYRSNHVCDVSHSIPMSRVFTLLSQRKYASVSRIVPFKLSDIGEGIREVTIKEWFVKVGDKVSQFDNICEVQSDKASVTITSRYDGTITKLYHNVDDAALVGEPLVDLEVFDNCTNTDTGSSQESTKENRNIEEKDHVGIREKVLTTPAVRRLASEEKVDLQKVSGTGRHGRVLKEDVLAYLEDLKKKQTDATIAQEALRDGVPATSHAFSTTSARTRQEPIRGFAKTMVKTMSAANMIPHFVYSDEINVGKISNIIQELKQYQTAIKFTYMPFFIKAASKCLENFPVLNSSVDEKCENIIYKANHNIGVAMDTAAGLVVPNIKHVEELSIRDIAQELMRLHKAGLSGSLLPADLTGGTFTLSNIGTVGGTYTKPVILPPEVAIGAIGTLQVLPRYDDEGNIVKTRIMYISWAADHRIIDGATMARFSNMWKHYIQNPYKLILNF